MNILHIPILSSRCEILVVSRELISNDFGSPMETVGPQVNKLFPNMLKQANALH